MRRSVALIACLLAGGAVFVGLKLSSAVGQVSAFTISRPAEGGMGTGTADRIVEPQAAAATHPEAGVHDSPALAASPEHVGAGSDSGDPPDAADGAPASAPDERELWLGYFGPEVSLNDLGQLAVPDPEFERAIRERANEIGEIPAAP